jgi:hypothetical protein
MTPEIETLDQLLGGDLPLKIICNLYPDADAFRRGVFGLLSAGDVCLLMIDQTGVPTWRWRELFVEGKVMTELGSMKLSITAQGARRVA